MFSTEDIREYNWSNLYYVDFEIAIGIDALECQLNKFDRIVRFIQLKFEKHVQSNDFMASLDERSQSQYYSQYYEAEQLTVDKIKLDQRYSMLVAIYSFFEGQLKKICEDVERKFDLDKKLSQFKEEDYSLRYWNFLTTVYKLDRDKVEKHYTKIKQLKELRNKMVHQNGVFSKTELKSVYPVPMDGIEMENLNDNLKILITDICFLNQSLGKLKVFFKALIESLEERHNELNVA